MNCWLELLKWTQSMLEQLPGGIDYEARGNDQSPEDLTAHIAGLIYQRIDEALQPKKVNLNQKKKETSYDR